MEAISVVCIFTYKKNSVWAISSDMTPFDTISLGLLCPWLSEGLGRPDVSAGCKRWYRDNDLCEPDSNGIYVGVSVPGLVCSSSGTSGSSVRPSIPGVSIDTEESD